MVFVGSGFVGRAISSLITVEVGGEDLALKEWLFGALEQALPGPKAASLGFALAWVAAWFVALQALFRRGVAWRV